MSDRRRQQRAALIVGGAAVGGLAIIGLAIALTSGGDDSSSIDTRRTTTSSSSTTSSSTSTSTTTTLVTLPPTFPTTTPTSIVFPTTVPPTQPPTVPTTIAPTSPTTQAPTTSTTKPLTPSQQLALEIGTALNGGDPPGPGDNRVTSVHIADPDDSDDETRVRWELISTLTPEEQATQARLDAWNVLKTIQAADLEGDNDIAIRATIPNESPPPETEVVILLKLSRESLDAIDFDTLPADDILSLALCDDDPMPPCYVELDVDTAVVPAVTTSTSSTTSTTEP